MHSAEKAHNTTLDDDNASQHVMALYNQPEAFASDGDDQWHYLYLTVDDVCRCGRPRGGQPDVDKSRQGGLKITKFLRTSFMDGS